MSRPLVIGYYVNHGGQGHLQRALAVIPHLSAPVVLFGEFPLGSFILPPNTTYVELPSDATLGYKVRLGRPYLYAPWGTSVHQRYALILAAIITHKITHLHADVSPEVLSFAKILGLTTSTILMQGLRTDRAHTLGYEMADAVIAPFAPDYVNMANYHIDKAVTFVGGISRFAGHPATTQEETRQKLGWQGRNILVTTSFGGTAKAIDWLVAAATMFPDTMWHIIGNYQIAGELPANLHGRKDVANPSDQLQAADYVLGTGGNNSIMEAADFGKKYACVPEPRHYDEQIMAGLSLSRLQAAVVIHEYPWTRSGWQGLFAALDGVDVAAFRKLVRADAAWRMAETITATGLKQPLSRSVTANAKW